MKEPYLSLPYIFISHSHIDNAWCETLTLALRDQGYDTWIDLREPRGEMQWLDEIQNELQSRDIIVVILTPDAWKSDWVHQEMNLAMTKKKILIPVHLKQTKVDGFLLNYQ
jgi:hypothetical protein